MAVTLADAGGEAAVSMRRIARELGVTPMALYWHFADKRALLGAMAEQVILETHFDDDPTADWRDRYRNVLAALVDLLHAHSWMGRLVIERVVLLPSYLAALETMLDSLRVAGLAPDLAAMVVQQSVQTVVGLVDHEPPKVVPETEAIERAVVEASLRDLDPTEFPNVRAAAASLVREPHVDDYYRTGLDTLVGGIEVVAAAPATARVVAAGDCRPHERDKSGGRRPATPHTV
ncbi:TetR/AcrR family transcriptional regulator [Terrabacter sp. Ter38]|uniref:TetR/AcrR family transcriptional regulator n=1 Tax=Terrabacter sp. Ter38 TaxID=2926030 RepID=UPI0027E528DB|nr:TetR/AcrR family transcriptional regulator [Terrabacter sp. Ter38]